MKSKRVVSSGERIRAKVLWPAGLLLAAGVIALILSRSYPRHPASEQAHEAAVVVSNAALPGVDPSAAPFHFQTPPPPPADLDAARLISLMSDKSSSLQIRRQAARSLAKLGTDEAMIALRTALTNDSPPYLKAAIAEGLGQCPNPEARELLHELTNRKDETTARGAVRGLASRGDADAVDALGSLLFNEHTPLSVRTEAALGLGDVDVSAAQDLLTRAVAQIHDEDVLESVLDGLGRRPFSETEEFFRGYLNSPDVPAKSKVLAIQAITDADGDVGPFLQKFLNDANPDVRAAAKEALDSIGSAQ